ncbi:MAG: hypothetical protein BGO31_09490 [Bacteroidetes bacterium 43-16]|nr:MAG: hypothetical protein BGO31_09490 [Bacteroidetes bacterium 43-16]
MRIVFFIVYISLFFCKNVGAIQHAHTYALQHGHFSMPKSNTSGQHAGAKAEQTYDFGLLEGFDDLGDLELHDDVAFNAEAINLNWLSNYLNFLLSVLQSEEAQQATHFAFDPVATTPAPIYILNQVFRI